MSEDVIRFDDGAAYERMMGVWSRLVGEEFLDWLAPAPDQSWIDVGCGNGAFTDLLVQRCRPREVLGVDPSEGQIAYARTRMANGVARFERGGALALPAADAIFDAAVMALVIFFVPEPERGVAEMRRVVRSGGSVSAYAWDVLAPEGFPMWALQDELRQLGIAPILPPRADASPVAALQALWSGAGLVEVTTRQITVTRTFRDFDDYWATVEIAIGMAQSTTGLSADAKAQLKDRLRERLPAGADGSVSFSARANAVQGRVPA